MIFLFEWWPFPATTTHLRFPSFCFFECFLYLLSLYASPGGDKDTSPSAPIPIRRRPFPQVTRSPHSTKKSEAAGVEAARSFAVGRECKRGKNVRGCGRKRRGLKTRSEEIAQPYTVNDVHLACRIMAVCWNVLQTFFSKFFFAVFFPSSLPYLLLTHFCAWCLLPFSFCLETWGGNFPPRPLYTHKTACQSHPPRSKRKIENSPFPPFHFGKIKRPFFWTKAERLAKVFWSWQPKGGKTTSNTTAIFRTQANSSKTSLFLSSPFP